MLQRIVALLSLASLCVLSLMLTFTSPASAGPFGLLVVFISAYLTFVGLVSYFLFGMNRLIRVALSGMTIRKPLKAMTFKRAYYFSTVLAVAPVLFVGLQSVQAIGVYEVALIIAFEIVACIYVGRRTQP